MRRSFLLLPFSFFLFSFSTLSETTRVIFFGDSITEAGVQPGGYITRIQEQLTAQGRSDNFELIGAGIGGNKVYDLFLRLEPDVLANKPDVVVIFVGINDVWHKRSFGTGTDPDKFQRFYAALIEKMQVQGIRLILCTPPCIGERVDCSNTMDGELNQYSQIIRYLARQYNCTLCDLRPAFQAYQAAHNTDNRDSGILTSDGVHLNDAGNALVAELLLKAI